MTVMIYTKSIFLIILKMASSFSNNTKLPLYKLPISSIVLKNLNKLAQTSFPKGKKKKMEKWFPKQKVFSCSSFHSSLKIFAIPKYFWLLPFSSSQILILLLSTNPIFSLLQNIPSLLPLIINCSITMKFPKNFHHKTCYNI